MPNLTTHIIYPDNDGLHFVPSSSNFFPLEGTSATPQEFTISSSASGSEFLQEGLIPYIIIPVLSGSSTSDRQDVLEIIRYHTSSYDLNGATFGASSSLYFTSSNTRATYRNVAIESTDSPSQITTKTFNKFLNSSFNSKTYSASKYSDESIKINFISNGYFNPPTIFTSSISTNRVFITNLLTGSGELNYTEPYLINVASSSISFKRDGDDTNSMEFTIGTGSFGYTEGTPDPLMYFSSSGKVGFGTRTPKAEVDFKTDTFIIRNVEGTRETNIDSSGRFSTKKFANLTTSESIGAEMILSYSPGTSDQIKNAQVGETIGTINWVDESFNTSATLAAEDVINSEHLTSGSVTQISSTVRQATSDGVVGDLQLKLSNPESPSSPLRSYLTIDPLTYGDTVLFPYGINVNGNISGSSTSTLTIGGRATFGTDTVIINGADGHITASGNISASGDLTADKLFIKDASSRTTTINNNQISATNHFTVQADASYLNISSPNNSVYYKAGSNHVFKNGNGTSTYLTIDTNGAGEGNISSSGNFVANQITSSGGATFGSNVGIGGAAGSKTLNVTGTMKSSGEAFWSHFDNLTSNSRFRDDLALYFGVDRVLGWRYNSTLDKLVLTSGSANHTLTLDGSGNISGSGTLTMGNITTTGITNEGDLTVTGTVTAQEFHTEFVSASIMFESGSTKFGDTSDDTHQFTGSILVTGSATIDVGSAGRKIYLTDHSGYANIDADSALYLGGTATSIQFRDNAIPSGDSETDLGASNRYWANFYADNAVVGNITASGTISASGDIIANTFRGENNVILDVGSANQMVLNIAGANELIFDASQMYPATNNGQALGYPGNGFADLFLASGAVINFNNGDSNLTHTASTLTLSGSGGTSLNIEGNITASGNISASGTLIADGATLSAPITIAAEANETAVHSTIAGNHDFWHSKVTRDSTLTSYIKDDYGRLTLYGNPTNYTNASAAVSVITSGMTEGGYHFWVQDDGGNKKLTLDYSGDLHLPTGYVSASGFITTGNVTASRVILGSGEYLSWGSTGTTAIEGSTVSNKINFRTNGSSQMFLNSTGLGIGTTAPTEKLQVTGNISASGTIIADQLHLMGTSGNVTFDSSTSGDLTIDAADDIRLDAGGADIVFKYQGTEIGRFTNDSSDFKISTSVTNKNIILDPATNGTGFVNITGSLYVDGPTGNITASGNISSSGTITANSFVGTFTGGVTGDATGLTGTPNISVGHITASGNISASGDTHIFGGQVGIDTAPAAGVKLHVNGEIRVDSTNGVATRKVRSDYFSSTTDVTLQPGSSGSVIIPSGHERALLIGTSTPAALTEKLVVEGNISASGTGSFSDGRFTGKVGIGTTTPSNTLHVVGAIFSNTHIQTPTGYITTNVPYSTNEDLTLRLRNSANKINFQDASSANLMTISGSGKVGIGTTSPGEKLEVVGNISASGNFVANQITASGDMQLGGILRDITLPTSYYIDPSGVSRQNNITLAGTLNNGFNAIMGRITASGDISSSGTIIANKIGVGTSNPTSTAGSDNFIQIYGAVDSGLGIKSNNADWEFKNENPSGDLSLFSGGSSRVTFEEAGNVGIGTKTPTEKLQVTGNISASGNLTVGGSDTVVVSETGIVLSRSNSYIQSAVDNSTTLNIGQSSVRWGHVKVDAADFVVLNGGNERMKVASSGKVGIGNTAPPEALTVTGNISASGNILANQIGTNKIEPGLIGAASPYTLELKTNDLYHNGSSFRTGGHITASGNISSSGTVTANSFVGTFTGGVTGDATGLTGTPNISVGHITASGNISASGTGSFTHYEFPGSSGNITGHLIPSADATYDLGHTTSKDWNNLYVRAIDIHNQRFNLGYTGTTATLSDHSSVGDGFQFMHLNQEILRLGNDGDYTANFSANITSSGTISASGTIIASKAHIATPGIFTANTSADELVVGSGVGSQGISIYSGDTSVGGIYFAEDLDEEGAGDSPAGNRHGVFSYSHNNSEFNLKTGGNQSAATIAHDGSTFHSNLTVEGSITAREFHTEFVSASIMFSSGSTKFGDSSDDVHSMTGSLNLTGSQNITGDIDFFTNSGNNYGNITADSEGLTFDTVANRHMRFMKAGVETMRIDTSGNVGIGISVPVAKLHVDSDTAFSLLSGSGDTLLLTNDSTTSAIGAIGPSIGFGNMNTDLRKTAIGTIRTGADHDQMGLAFFTHPSSGNDETIVQQMVIDHDGNVGIGTSTPTEALQVIGNISASGTGSFSDGRFTGKVGIGTATPLAPLDVNGNIYSSGNVVVDNIYSRGGSSDLNLGARSGYGVNIHQLSGNSIAYFDYDTTNVGIGTTTPSANLEVSGSVTISGSAGAGSTTTLLNVGGLANGRMLVRHIDGKNSTSAATSGLYLNYGSSGETSIGAGGGNVGIGLSSGIGEKLTVAGNISASGTVTSAGLQVNGATYLDVMSGHQVEGIVRIGRYDANTSRYHDIKSYVSSTAASNYLKFSLHGGTEDAVADVLTLKGDLSATFAGKVGIGATATDFHADADDLVVGGGSGNTGITIHSGTGGFGSIFFADGTADDATEKRGQIRYLQGTERMDFHTDNVATAALSLAANGNATFAGNISASGTGSFSDGRFADRVVIGGGAQFANSGLTVIGESDTNVVLTAQSTDNQAWISVQDDDSGTYGALFGTDTDAGHAIVLADKDANKRLVISSSGNVGIGTTTPSYKLEVTGNVFLNDGASELILDNSTFSEMRYGTSCFFRANGSQTIIDSPITIIKNLGTEVINITGSNVGIGTTTPTQKLDVNGNMIADTYYVANTSNYIDIATGLRLRSNSDGIRLMPNGTDAGYIKHTGVSFTLPITASGNISASGTVTANGITTSGNIIPSVDNSLTLGSSDYRFRNLYTGDIQLNNEGTEGNEVDGTTGNWTIQEGKEDLFIINRKTGKKFKFKLEEIE